jgi:uncharacterized membrane protein
MPRNWWSVAAGPLTVAILVLMVLVPWTRLLLVAPLVLFLPGLLIGGGLFSTYRILSVELLVVAVAFSFAIAIVGGLLLAISPWGLATVSWVGYCAVVAIVAAAIWRRGRGAWWPKDLVVNESEGSPPRAWRGPTAAFAALLVAVAFAIASLATANDKQAFTELTVASAGSSGAAALRISVVSHESQPVRYRLVLTNRGATVVQYLDIHLDPGQSWQQETTIPIRGLQEVVNVALYRADASGTTPYRSASVSVAWAEGAP